MINDLTSLCHEVDIVIQFWYRRSWFVTVIKPWHDLKIMILFGGASKWKFEINDNQKEANFICFQPSKRGHLNIFQKLHCRIGFIGKKYLIFFIVKNPNTTKLNFKSIVLVILWFLHLHIKLLKGILEKLLRINLST